MLMMNKQNYSLNFYYHKILLFLFLSNWKWLSRPHTFSECFPIYECFCKPNNFSRTLNFTSINSLIWRLRFWWQFHFIHFEQWKIKKNSFSEHKFVDFPWYAFAVDGFVEICILYRSKGLNYITLFFTGYLRKTSCPCMKVEFAFRLTFFELILV